MIHIKKINEMAFATENEKTSNVEYRITRCEYVNGIANSKYGELHGDIDENYKLYRTRRGINANTLETLMKKFVEQELPQHVFNIDDWSYDSENGCLDLFVLGSLNGYNEYYIDDLVLKHKKIPFNEPSQKEMENFENKGATLLTFYFRIYVEKKELLPHFINEFNTLKK